jgi:hypothetical protein
MIPVNRETLLIIGTIVCALGVFYLFNELKKTRQDVDNFKDFSEQVVKQLSAPPVKVEPVPVPEEVEEKVEE